MTEPTWPPPAHIDPLESLSHWLVERYRPPAAWLDHCLDQRALEELWAKPRAYRELLIVSATLDIAVDDVPRQALLTACACARANASFLDGAVLAALVHVEDGLVRGSLLPAPVEQALHVTEEAARSSALARYLMRRSGSDMLDASSAEHPGEVSLYSEEGARAHALTAVYFALRATDGAAKCEFDATRRHLQQLGFAARPDAACAAAVHIHAANDDKSTPARVHAARKAFARTTAEREVVLTTLARGALPCPDVESLKVAIHVDACLRSG